MKNIIFAIIIFLLIWGGFTAFEAWLLSILVNFICTSLSINLTFNFCVSFATLIVCNLLFLKK